MLGFQREGCKPALMTSVSDFTRDSIFTRPGEKSSALTGLFFRSPLQISPYIQKTPPSCKQSLPGSSFSDGCQLFRWLRKRGGCGSHFLQDTALPWGFQAHARAWPGALVTLKLTWPLRDRCGHTLFIEPPRKMGTRRIRLRAASVFQHFSLQYKKQSHP